MSEEKFEFEADRWRRQAAEDLDVAEVLRDAEKYAQSCFYTQQASEKAMKSTAWKRGVDLWGHSLLKLREKLLEIGVDVESVQKKDLILLDRFYIPTCYPNGLPEIIPQEGFCRDDADQGIAAARRILAWADES